LTRITRLSATGTRQHLADGYERLERLSAEVAGPRLAWTERRLGVRSRQRARAGETALRARLARARAAVTALNDRGRGKRRCTELPALQGAVETILARYRVLGLLAVQYTERVRQRWRRR
jgi:transposase